jgi:hypothetical protein
MTAKAWCAISKAVEMVATTQGASQERAQAWLIETCASGNVRARASSSANRATLLAADSSVEMDMRSRSRLSLALGPVPPNIWKDAVIDGDALVDADRGHRRGFEVSIVDLEFELKRSFPAPNGKPASSAPISRSGARPSDKEAIMAEAERRLAAGECMPSSLAAFARDLHLWLDKQRWAYRRPMDGKVLAPSSVEHHIRPLWRKYRPE